MKYMLLEKIKESLLPLAEIEEIEVEKKVEAPPQEEAEGDASQEEQPAAVEIEIIKQPAVKTPDYAKKGFHLDVKVAPADVVAAAQELRKFDFFIEAVTGVDWIKENQLEVVYDFNHFDELCRVAIRTRIDRSSPELPTISGIYDGANWHERETHDFFGIVFTGHPDLSPLLLEEDADYHPLLKDFQA